MQKAKAKILGRDQKRFLQATEKTAVVDVENHQLHFSTGWRQSHCTFLLVDVDLKKCSLVNVDCTFHDQM